MLLPLVPPTLEAVGTGTALGRERQRVAPHAGMWFMGRGTWEREENSVHTPRTDFRPGAPALGESSLFTHPGKAADEVAP